VISLNLARERAPLASDVQVEACFARIRSLMISFAPGEIFLEKYRIEEVLGQGGMGVVVAARHIELDELVAIKFLHATFAMQPEQVERFLREGRAG
jgi:serine/threonine protein kinase